MKKIIYLWIFFVLSIHAELLCQRAGTVPHDPPLPNNVRPDCIDETALTKAPCCDVKIPFRYKPSPFDGWGTVFNEFTGQITRVFNYYGSWDYRTNIISTNTDNAYNPERPELRNRFDWRRSPFTAFYPNNPGSAFYGTSPRSITNPYYDFGQRTLSYFSLFHTPASPNMFDTEKMDFHPRDGWEVLHRHFGYNPDEITIANSAYDSRSYPYLLMYNRYTGKLRQIAYLPKQGGTQLFMKLGYPDNTGNPNSLLKFSGMFNGYNGLFRALDKKTTVSSINSPANPNDYDGAPTAADFDIAYDPCVCNHKSELYFSYESIVQASLQMEGRIVGTNVPLNGSGNIQETLLNGKDFLWAVNKPGFSVKGGRQTYFNIDQLVTRYKEPPKTSPSFGDLIKGGLTDLLKLGIGAATGGIDRWLGGLTEKLARSLVPRVTSRTHTCTEYHDDGTDCTGNPNIVRKPIFNPEIIKIGGLGLAGLATNYFNSVLTPEQPKFTIPNISFLEAEGVFTGTATTSLPNNNNSIRLITPGSKDSNLPGLIWQLYPAYNEALGVFAVLKTPQVDTYSESLNSSSVAAMRRYKFSLRQDIKYTFNPAADIDEKKTQISASLVLKVGAKPWSSPEYMKADGLMYMGYNSQDNVYIYQTAMFPLSCMPNQIARLSVYDDTRDPIRIKPEIRLMIKTVTNGASGKINYGLLIYTYEAELNGVSSTDQPNGLLSSISINGTYYSPQYYQNDNQWGFNNWNLAAKHAIFINSALITQQETRSRPVTISAEEVDLYPSGNPTSSIATSDMGGPSRNVGDESTEPKESKIFIDIQYNTDITSKADECKSLSPAQSVSPAYVKAFCQGTSYKANELELKVKQEMEQAAEMGKAEQRIADENSIKFDVYPNPANNFVKASYELFSEEPITITIKNVSGETVMTILQSEPQKIGTHSLEFEVKSLLPGMYFCTFSNGKINKIQKLMIVK